MKIIFLCSPVVPSSARWLPDSLTVNRVTSSMPRVLLVDALERMSAKDTPMEALTSHEHTRPCNSVYLRLPGAARRSPRTLDQIALFYRLVNTTIYSEFALYINAVFSFISLAVLKDCSTILEKC